MWGVLWAGAVVASSPAVHALGAGAQAYIPNDAVGVMVWNDPAATLSRVETLMATSGLAPPGQEAGWLMKQFTDREPRLAALDWSQPIHLVMVPGPDGEFGMYAVASRKSEKATWDSQDADPFRVVTRKRLFLMLQKEVSKVREQPAKKPLKMPKEVQSFGGDNDVFVHFQNDRALAVMTQVAERDPTQAETLKALRDTLRDSESFTAGVALQTEGVFGRMLTLYDPKTPQGKMALATENTEAPLITGLPSQPYVMLMGSRGSSAETAEAVADTVIQQMLKQLSEESDEVTKAIAAQVKKLQAVYKGKFVDGQTGTFGVAMPGDWQSLHMVGWMEGSSEKSSQLMDEMMKWLAELLGEVEELSGEDAPVKLEKVEPKKVKGTSMLGYALQFKEAPPDLPEVAKALLKSPVLWGKINKKKMVMTWNAPDPVQTSLISGPTSKLLASPKFSRTQKALPKRRSAEFYLDVGPLAAIGLAQMNPMMAQGMKAMLSTLPAFGGTMAATGPGTRIDLFIPVEAIQVAGGMAALLQP